MSDPSTTVGAAQAVSDLTPYVQSVVAAIVVALGGIVTAAIRKYVGIAVSQDLVDKVDAYVEQLAAAEVAKAADNLAKTQINVGSPIVKGIVDQVASALPAELDALGLTTEAVASKVAGAFGKLQASMTAVPAAPAVAATGATVKS